MKTKRKGTIRFVPTNLYTNPLKDCILKPFSSQFPLNPLKFVQNKDINQENKAKSEGKLGSQFMFVSNIGVQVHFKIKLTTYSHHRSILLKYESKQIEIYLRSKIIRICVLRFIKLHCCVLDLDA